MCLIGAGPRGASILERLGDVLSTEGGTGRLVIHVVDPHPPGPGRVWRTDQPRSLSMNTLAGSVTMFADRGSGPITGRAGPAFLEWCRTIAPGDARLDDGARAEAAALAPSAHASRALYGAYLRWFFEEALRRLPDSIEVRLHRDTVRGIRNDGAFEIVDLEDGEPLRVDAVVVASGWLARTLTDEERSGARADVWIGPGHPADQDLDRIPPGADVLVRGLGMGFFDTLSRLADRSGGRIVREGDGLSYRPGGGEPTVTVVSGRGIPYLAKSVLTDLPSAPVLRRLRRALADGASTFDADVWSALVGDVHEAFHRARRPDDPRLPGIARALDAVRIAPYDLAASDDAVAAALRPTGSDNGLRLAPVFAAVDSGDPDDVDAAIAARAARDLDEARKGAGSPIKAALWEFSAARPLLSRAFQFVGPVGAGRRAYAAYLSDAGFAGSGPPAERVAHMLAWRDAGLLRFGGPSRRAGTGARASAQVVVDAWLPLHDLRETRDPVLRSLVSAGRLRTHTLADAAGMVETAGIAIDPESGRAVRADGTIDPRVWVIGIPLEATRGDTIIAPLIGADSTLLRETDLVARGLAVLAR